MTAEYRAKPRDFLLRVGLRAALGLGLAACCVLSSASAGAQSASDSATAQALFDRAKKLMSDGKYAEACSALEESQRIESRSGTALNLADCYEHVGRLASAWSTFLEAATLAKASGNTPREQGARARATALATRLSNLVINAPSAASTPGLKITRDGKAVGPAQLGLPLPADAGTHVVAAKAPGRKPWRTEVIVQNGASTANVTVPDLEAVAATAVAAAPAVPALAPPASTPASTPGAASPERPAKSAAPTPSEPPATHTAPSHRNGGVIAGGVVTGVLAVGTVVTSVLYSSKLHDYNAANDQLASNAESLRSQTKTLGVANLALLGGTVVAAGVTIFLATRPHSEQGPQSARWELRGVVSPGLAGMTLGASL